MAEEDAQGRPVCVSCKDPSTQTALNDCAGQAYLEADAELNRVYHQVLQQNREDRDFVDKLKKSQRAWLLFRDAEVEARYPPGDYGTALNLCEAQLKEELTRARTAQLRAWLEGVDEGDVCAGSLPSKE